MPMDDGYFWNEQNRRVLEELERDLQSPRAGPALRMADRFSLPTVEPGPSVAAIVTSMLLFLVDGVTVAAAGMLSSLLLTVIGALIFATAFVPILKSGRRRGRGHLERGGG